jgi:ABC-type transporter Mla subunit MlaD
MSRAGDSVTRVDIRFSNEMYEEIQQLAIKDGAKTHHISQKVEVSPTIVKLVQLGLDALNGKLPDSDGSIPDILPDTLSGRKDTISDIVTIVSDKVTGDFIQSISIERERIDVLLRKLTAKGIIDPIDIPTDNLSQLPDNIESLSDTLSGKDDIISDIDSNLSVNLSDINNLVSDNVETVPDYLSDNGENLTSLLSGKDEMISDKEPDKPNDAENIPSDDSSNSESVAEDTSLLKRRLLQTQSEQVSGENPQSFSFVGFHDWLELEQPGKRNKVNGDLAIATAKEKGLGVWKMDSKSYKFTKTTGD